MRRTAAEKSLLQNLDLLWALLAVRPFGLFVDLDGTISPIADDPMSARAT